jgi:putative transposase
VLRRPFESSQDACGDYTDLLKAHGIVARMSRIGHPYDNAKVESFMTTLKQEEIDGRSYRDLRHARRHIGSFIEQVYNRHRLHSALDYRSPLEFEVGHATPTVTVTAAMGFQGMGNLPR